MTRAVAARSARWTRRGLRPGDRVFLHSGNRLEFFAELLALWRLGACAVPLDPRLTRVELERLVEATSPRFSVVDDSVEVASALPASIAVVGADETDGTGDLPPDLAEPGADALILFTSGSSGRPKGVVHTHASLRARWAALRHHLGLAAYARTLCLLPTHFGHGLICNSLFPWLAGQDLFITPPFRPDLLARLGALIDEHHITFLSSVPAVWRLALKVAKPPRRAPLERVHCGSAPLPAGLWDGIREWSGTKEVFNTYGLTETGSWVAGTSGAPPPPGRGRGGARWGATIRVRRAADAAGLAALGGAECAPGETGHVWLATPALMRGYLGRDDLTRRVLVDGHFATGDLGTLDERGWLHLRGRERDEINKGGMKIAPAEVDAAAEGCPGVAEVCAFAVDDPLYGQNVGLAVTMGQEGDAAVGDLYRWMRERLAETKLPARWWRVDAMPRSDRGKVSRDAVREACTARPPLDLTRILQGR